MSSWSTSCFFKSFFQRMLMELIRNDKNVDSVAGVMLWSNKLLHPVKAIVICIELYASRQLFLDSFNFTLPYEIALALRTRNRLSLS